MADNSLKTIRELINSTNSVDGYGSGSLGRKQFGSIYAFNKTIRPTAMGTAIEVSMMITGLTDFIKAGASKKPVAAHKVSIAIKGIKQETMSALELAEYIKLRVPAMKDLPNEAIVQEALRQEKPIIQDKTILPSAKASKLTVEALLGGKDKDPKLIPQDTFTVVDDHISANAKIQVHCSCSSYYWVFQWYNVDNNVDIFNVRPPAYTYSRTSSKTYRRGKQMNSHMAPVRNPQRAFGMCKHLTLLLGMLMDQKVIDKVNRGAKNSPADSYKLNITRFKQLKNISPQEYDKLTKAFKRDQSIKTEQRKAWYGKTKREAKKGAFWKKNIKGK